MKVKITYSKTSFDDAVKFISKNNIFFSGKDKLIKKSLLSSINELVSKYPEYTSISTMGYLVDVQELELEDIDNDENIFYIGIWIDPSLYCTFFQKYKTITKNIKPFKE